MLCPRCSTKMKPLGEAWICACGTREGPAFIKGHLSAAEIAVLSRRRGTHLKGEISKKQG